MKEFIDDKKWKIGENEITLNIMEGYTRAPFWTNDVTIELYATHPDGYRKPIEYFNYFLRKKSDHQLVKKRIQTLCSIFNNEPIKENLYTAKIKNNLAKALIPWTTQEIINMELESSAHNIACVESKILRQNFWIECLLNPALKSIFSEYNPNFKEIFEEYKHNVEKTNV